MKLLSKFIVTALGLTSMPLQVVVVQKKPKTVPVELSIGVKQLPNIHNDSAVDANAVAKGYSLVNVSFNC